MLIRSQESEVSLEAVNKPNNPNMLKFERQKESFITFQVRRAINIKFRLAIGRVKSYWMRKRLAKDLAVAEISLSSSHQITHELQPTNSEISP